MFYMSAERDADGNMHVDTLAGFIDDSLVVEEAEFLKSMASLTPCCDTIFGIVSSDVQDVLLAAY